MASPRFAWLLDVELPTGRVLRYSVDALDVDTADGDVLDYAPGLLPMELGQGDPEVAVSLADDGQDWPVIGPLLDGAHVTLRRHREGDLLERAETYALGIATGSEWGSFEDKVVFSISSVETLPPMPEPDAVVSTKTSTIEDGVSRIPADQEGLFYPTVLGLPGYFSTISEEYSSILDFRGFVVPVPMRIEFLGAAQAPDSQIVVSSDPTAFFPATVQMRENATATETALSGPLECELAVDDLGRSVVVAVFSDFRLSPNGDDAPEYFMAVGPDDGGTPAPRKAYDVLRYLLGRFGGTTVDWSRLPEVAEHLDPYLVDTWITEPMDEDSPDAGYRSSGERRIWQWFVEALGVAPLGSTRSSAGGLPIAIRLSTEGRYFAPLKYSVDPRRTRRVVDLGGGEASRAGTIRLVGNRTNQIVAKYAKDLVPAYIGEFPDGIATASVISDAFLTLVVPSGIATASAARYGIVPYTLPVPWTWDPATVARLGLDMIEREALPWRHVKARVPEEWALREGDQVRLVDEATALDELAIVEGTPLVGGAGGMTVTFRMPGVR